MPHTSFHKVDDNGHSAKEPGIAEELVKAADATRDALIVRIETGGGVLQHGHDGQTMATAAHVNLPRFQRLPLLDTGWPTLGLCSTAARRYSAQIYACGHR